LNLPTALSVKLTILPPCRCLEHAAERSRRQINFNIIPVPLRPRNCFFP
jgi:hypothetical protein